MPSMPTATTAPRSTLIFWCSDPTTRHGKKSWRTWDRAVQGKDYYDILNLIRIHKLDTTSQEFLEILDRYATESIRERLLSDIKGLV